ncbi:unnamed protein product [Arctogadus glacialis]
MIVGKNKLADRKQRDLLTLLRSIAWARTEESCLLALGTLRDSYLYKDNQQVRAYVEQRWLAIKEKWCRAYVPEAFHVSVTTNNGFETMNKNLKAFYLKISASVLLPISLLKMLWIKVMVHV